MIKLGVPTNLWQGRSIMSTYKVKKLFLSQKEQKPIRQ